MHISLLVQQNEALLLALFQKVFQTETYKAKSKHSQTACPSDTFTVFVAWTPLDTMGQTQLLCCNSIALQGSARMSLRAPGPIFFICLIFNSCSVLGSTLFHRNSKGDYIKLEKPFFRPTLYLCKEA